MSKGTVEDLVDRIGADISWRKRELQAYKSLVQGQRNPLSREVLLRAGVPLVYAHWEGFVKASAREYLNFVAIRRLTYKELSTNFVALDLERRLRDGTQILSAKVIANIIEQSKEERSRFGRISDRFDNVSNLSFRVLSEIANLMGLDQSSFETKRHLIDEQLLKSRNNIAHGKWFVVEQDFFEQIFEAVVEMMEVFRNQIENAAIMGTYRVAPADNLVQQS